MMTPDKSACQMVNADLKGTMGFQLVTVTNTVVRLSR